MIKRLQSSMEYLMTYGWAVLIMAVVLVGLFFLGVFNFNATSAAGGCIADPGYLCATPVYSHSTGNVALTFGQRTGSAWPTANVVFVNQSFESNVLINGFTFISKNAIQEIPGGLSSGQTWPVTLPATANVVLGLSLTGYIWIGYTTSSSPTALYQKVAAISVKST